MSADDAWISGTHFCSACGWPVVGCCANDNFYVHLKQQGHKVYDYWYYCSNKGCENHVGTDYDPQHPPAWIDYRNLETE